MKKTIAVLLAVAALSACDNGDRKGTGQVDKPAPAPLCDWETQLWDGTQCLSRTDHESHMGG